MTLLRSRLRKTPLRPVVLGWRRLVQRSGALSLLDPTLWPPPGYTKARANAVYGEAFRRCFEYMRETSVRGHVLEFGTLRGYTARLMATLMVELQYDERLFLYDSFEGLPEIDSPVDRDSYEVAVSKVWFKGQMDVRSTSGDVSVRIERTIGRILSPSRLSVVKGYYEDTLAHGLPSGKAALVHLDCDLYSSARCVLDELLKQELFQDGSLLVFDDYNCNHANPTMGERRALTEVFASQERFTYSPWFSYGPLGQVFFVHDTELADRAVLAGMRNGDMEAARKADGGG